MAVAVKRREVLLCYKHIGSTAQEEEESIRNAMQAAAYSHAAPTHKPRLTDRGGGKTALLSDRDHINPHSAPQPPGPSRPIFRTVSPAEAQSEGRLHNCLAHDLGALSYSFASTPSWQLLSEDFVDLIDRRIRCGSSGALTPAPSSLLHPRVSVTLTRRAALRTACMRDVPSPSSTPPSVSQLSPGSLAIYLIQGTFSTIPCCPSAHLSSSRKPVEAVTVTLQADMSEGMEVLFCWGLTHKKPKKIMEDVKKASPSSSDYLKSTLVAVCLFMEAESNHSSENPRDCICTEKDCNYELLFDIPRGVTSNQVCLVSFSISGDGLKTSESYNVVAAASWGQMSVTSDMFPIEVQRAVKLSRLVHQASVLRNRTLTITCRVNVGTNLTFIWSFGDGTTRPGLSTTHHVFHRLGEFIVKVTASNLISSASLSSHIFVVDQPCQPPPVKNMGPLKLQFKRYEVIHLGVMFETDVDCDISEGLLYSWTLFGSGGQIIPLPQTDTQRQSLILQRHLLQYDTYMAIARVQVIGSVVYSNYTVTFQVKPSPPVAFIQGGTNIFIGKKSSNVTLDGQKSYDPDFPKNLLSYSWTCKPVSTIISSCFDQDIPTSSPVLKFPSSLLKPKFDQFQFMLTVHSRERSASSEAFLTVTSHLTGKVSVFCHQCQGDCVNWDQSFSISALCEDCNIRSELIQYTWSLYLVNASSKPIIEVPFCYTVDASAPSAILENPTTSTLTPEMSSLHPPSTDVLQNHHPADASFPAFLTEKIYQAKFRPQTSYVGDRKTSSEESRDESNQSATGFDDYDIPYPSVEEGDLRMSAGRSNGLGAEIFSPIDDSVFDLTLLKNEGSNLVDPKPSLVIQEPTLLDLRRDAVERGLFESYTYTGISSTLLIFRPFSLKPRSIYMLQVTAKSQNNWIGQTQLFLKTNPVPEGMRCQVQPVEGMELHTSFSIFCTSGQEDLEYKYSFSVGGKPPRTMYQGRNFQYYFSLPSGDPRDDYEVKIYTEIRSSSSGSATKPCPVTVRVRPSFLRNTSSSSPSHHDPALKLSESLRNLSTLIQLGNPVEIRNYISLLTSILNKLSQDAEANTHAQRHTRNVLICSLCDLKGNDQISMSDNIFVLNELLQVRNQVTLMSVRHVATYIQSVSEMFPELSGNQDMLYSLINSLSYCLQESSTSRYVLLRNQINYHNFSITQELLQQAIQMTVVFTAMSSKPFPIMLLFRMFEKPTPSMHHLKKIHHWQQNTIRITLSPSYLNAAGIAYIALLDADFGRLPRSKRKGEQISYSLAVDSSLCLSWDGQQGAWTHHGCRTYQTDTSSAVNCSCYQLRPLTVFQQQIQSSQDTGDLDAFLSASTDLTVLSILAILVVLYILGLVWSERADVLSKENQRVHYLSDNNPADPYLYAVYIHTGLCSATRMTGKVYIVLYGENGFSQTKELQVPGCTLFRRNTKDTFILSAADSLGPVWGVHIWHDNSGSSPDWYLKQVVVSEVNRGQVEVRSWLFVSECWLAVNKGDGQVERMLRVCSEEIHFVKLLFLRFSDYLADFHMWLCVYSFPSPSSYTHTQRLSVCLLLLLGYACANTVIISHTDDQLIFEMAVIDISAISVTTGLLSVMVVLPITTLISFLFRLTGNKLMGSGIQSKHGMRFSNRKVLLWIHSLCVSLMGCMFFIQPALLLRARQRARHLRLTHPPTPAELKKTRGKRRRETLIQETLSSVKEHQNLNKALNRHYIRNIYSFTSTKTHEDWTQSSLLDFLYQNLSAKPEQPHIVIGEPIIQKTDSTNIFRNPMLTNPRTCDHPCSEKGATVSLLSVTLACYFCLICHSTTIMEVVSLLQTQPRGYVDVSTAASWEQNIRTLWGVILFLLTMKCVTLLGVNRTLSSSTAVLSQTFSSLLWPVVSGLILLLALSCSGNLLYAESSRGFSSVPRSLQILLCNYRGLRVTKSCLQPGQEFTYWAILFLTTTAVWATMTYVLEELESSIDELLFRLDVLSSSMHQTLRAHCYREEASPVLSASLQSSSMDTQLSPTIKREVGLFDVFIIACFDTMKLKLKVLL
ncbi:polycystin-1-like protein 1 [Anableps anableps]